jgi:hypothetical protein
MRARLNLPVRLAMGTLAITALSLATAIPAAAQSAPSDSRWQAWLGCWSPAGTLVRVVGKSTTSVVCVVPSSSPSAVDVMTVSGGKVVDRTHVDADGQPHALTKEGCTGFQTAKWSPSGRRVYLKSELNCNGAPATHVSGVYAMAGYGEWIDAQGMRVDKNSNVHAVRYREAADPGALPDEIASKLPAHSMSRSASMVAVTTPPSLGDVEEAAHELDPGVLSTWLVEADKLNLQMPARLNAKQLTELADHGVPSSVIDVMVGLSYPEMFAVNTTGNVVTRQNNDSVDARYASLASMSSLNPILGFDRFGMPIYSSESALMYGCSPWMLGPYNGWNLYDSMYGCNQFGYGYNGYASAYGFGQFPYFGGYFGPYYGAGYYGGYYGGGPVVVPKDNGGGTATHGHVVNGRGYTTGGSNSGGNASPRSNNSSPSNSGSGAGSGSGSGSGGAPPPSSPPPRTAQPRKP